MIYLDVYLNQIKKNKQSLEFYNSDQFREYCALNCYLNSFYRKDARIQSLIIEDIDQLNDEDIQLIDQAVNELKDTVPLLPEAFQKLIHKNSVAGIFFMIGDGTIDSHGLLVNEKSYIIIDMLSYIRGYDYYNPRSFLVHELSHAIHYSLTPEMYFENHKSSPEGLLKRILVEGIATYLTRYFTEESDEDVFWLGYLNKKEIEKWIENCRQKKALVSSRIRGLISDNIWQDQYQYELFSIIDPDNLWRGRLGYFYGYEIAKLYCDTNSVDLLLEAKYEGLINVIDAYFHLS
jgi:hypothetical protein